jgi:NADPH:quinone reductase-like Zn-dependent oxidoreductase
LPENADNALVRVRAFSCNYREKTLCITRSPQCGDHAFTAIGSDFVGEVLAVGSGIQSLKPGDRVIPNSSWSWPQAPHDRGIPTNHASKEYLIVHQDGLQRIPPTMGDEVAAAFTIGAETAFAMVRRLQLTAGDHVLVTAARSNTSLFALGALKSRGVKVYAVTSSTGYEDRLRQLGVQEVIQVERASQDWSAYPAVRAVLWERGGFDAVIDPFFDLHLARVVPLLVGEGRYISCGFYNQSGAFTLPAANLNLMAIMNSASTGNRVILGNCLGKRSDLQQAIDTYVAGKLPVVIDSVFEGVEICPYIERTFNDPNRFGKVVYRHSSPSAPR